MRILIAEDDAVLTDGLSRSLRRAGYAVDCVSGGTEADVAVSTQDYDLLILDLGLPGMPGIEVLTRWRAQGVTMPVLILTARGDWSDKVAGFRAGADDYAVKPFRLDEVVLRAQTLVRRAAGHARVVLTAGALAYDTQLGVITRNGVALRLTPFETRILGYLMHHPDRIVSRTELSEHLYDADSDRDFKSIEVVIGRLRRKIGEWLIETRRGEGYVLRRGA